MPPRVTDWLGYPANNYLIQPGKFFDKAKYLAEWPEEWGVRGESGREGSPFIANLFYMANMAGKEHLYRNAWNEDMARFWEIQIPAQATGPMIDIRDSNGRFEPMGSDYCWGPGKALAEFQAYELFSPFGQDDIQAGKLVALARSSLPGIQKTGFYRKTYIDYVPALILERVENTVKLAVRTGSYSETLHSFTANVDTILACLRRAPPFDVANFMDRDSYTGEPIDPRNRVASFMTDDKQVWSRPIRDVTDIRRCDSCSVSYAHYGTQIYCPKCRDNVKRCDICSNPRMEDLLSPGINGEAICEECRKLGSYIGLQRHDYRPERFHMNVMPDESVENTPMYGLEFEMDTKEWNDRDRSTLLLRNIMDRFPGAKTPPFFVKRDGSLTKGLEWVWHPHSVRMVEKRLEHIRPILSDLRRGGMRSHDTTTCGFHIHVSKASFGETEAARNYAVERLVALTEIFQVNIVKFSRRNRTGLMRYASPYLPESETYGTSLKEVERAIKTNAGRGHDARYKGINVRNSATIEFRFFRGTLVWKTIMASLYLTENLCALARDFSVPIEKITWDVIIGLNDRQILKDYWGTRKDTKIIEYVEDEPLYDDEMPDKE